MIFPDVLYDRADKIRFEAFFFTHALFLLCNSEDFLYYVTIQLFH